MLMAAEHPPIKVNFKVQGPRTIVDTTISEVRQANNASLGLPVWLYVFNNSQVREFKIDLYVMWGMRSGYGMGGIVP